MAQKTHKYLGTKLFCIKVRAGFVALAFWLITAPKIIHFDSRPKKKLCLFPSKRPGEIFFIVTRPQPRSSIFIKLVKNCFGTCTTKKGFDSRLIYI